MKISALMVAAALAMSTPAFAQKVSVEYAHGVDFSHFATYKWGKNKGQLPDTQEDTHIKRVLDRELQAKGLRRVDSGRADLVVTYQATMGDRKQEVDTYQGDDDLDGMGWGMGWGWGWGDDMDAPGYSTTTMVDIRKGALLVDIANPSGKAMVFRGYSSGAFHTDPVKEDKLMTKTVDKMFEHFPPKAKPHKS